MMFDLHVEVQGEKVRIFSHHEIGDKDNDNIDIFVNFNGTVYAGTVFTLENVRHLMSRSDLPNYFFCRHSVVVSVLNEESIENTVREMIEEGDLEQVFCRQEP